MTDTDIADKILVLYRTIHATLDRDPPDLDDDRATRLSETEGKLAEAFHALTGEKIGVALGWA